MNTLRLFFIHLVIAFVFFPFNNILAQSRTSQVFYIQHHTSGKYLHPSGGVAGQGVDLVLYDGVSEQAAFYIEYAEEGNWGYLVSAVNPQLTVHPRGSSINSGNGSLLGFWTGKYEGTQFRINPETKTIQHKSGRYWHPSGGSDMPGNGTALVIYDGENPNTKFKAVDSYGRAVDLLSPLTISSRWKMIESEENRTNTSIYLEKTVQIGSYNRTTTTNESEITLSVGLEGSFFGIGASTSTEYRSLFSQTKESIKNKKQVEKKYYTLYPGTSVFLWQKEIVSTHLNGSEATLSTNQIKWLPAGENPNY